MKRVIADCKNSEKERDKRIKGKTETIKIIERMQIATMQEMLSTEEHCFRESSTQGRKGLKQV